MSTRENRRREKSSYVAPVGGIVNPIDIQPATSQKLLYSIIRESNPVISRIAGYNNIFRTRLQQVVGVHKLYGQKDPLGRRSVYSLRITDIVPPSEHLSHYQASKRKATISASIMSEWSRTWIDKEGLPVLKENGEEYKQVGEPFLLTHIPIMRESYLDPIKDPRERYERGDDPLLPGGWYTIKGQAKYIVLYNKVKYDMPITYATSDGEVITNTVCTTPDLSTIRIIIKNDAQQLIQCHVSILGSDTTAVTSKNKSKLRYISLYDYMAILMTTKEYVGEGGKVTQVTRDPSDESISDLILSFVPEEHREACKFILLLSESHRPMAETIADVKSKIKISEKGYDLERSMVEEIFPIIPYELRSLKAKQLAYVASRHLLFMAGVNKAHDRDSTSIFRMDTDEIVITKLVADKLRALMDQKRGKNADNEATIMDLIDSSKAQAAIQRDEPITSLYVSIASLNLANDFTKLQEDIISGFSKGNFGGKNVKSTPGPTFKGGMSSGQQKGIVAKLDTYSLSQAWSCLTKRAIASSNKGKNIKVRSGHPARAGYEDLFKSPDTEMIGLIMFLAATRWESMGRDATPVVEAIGTLPPDSSSKYPDLVLVNGIIQGYSHGPSLVSRLIKLRENNGPLADFFDSMFFYDAIKKEVVILTDAGRATRPLLVVDGEELVIEKKKMWQASRADLLREGCVRYVDAYEAEYGAVIAQYPAYFRLRWSEIHKAEEVRDRLIRQRGNKTISGVDINRLLDTLKGFRIAFKKGVVPVVTEQVVSPEELERQIDLLNDHIKKARAIAVFDYCEIDADAIMGFSSAIVPFLNRNSGTKIAYSSHMNTQAIGQGSSNFILGNQPLLRLLNNGQRGLSETSMAPIVGTSILPASQNLVIAWSSGTAYGDFGGGGQEDAVVLNAKAVARGLLNYTIHKQVVYSSPANITAVTRSSRPTGEDYTESYANLDVRGVVKVGTSVAEGSILFSIENKTPDGTWKRRNVVAKPGETGIVTDVYYIPNPLYIQVCLSENRRPVPGSKVSLMHGNKGLVSYIIDEKDMPYDPVTGMRPDAIFNPIGLPTRGTSGAMLEMVCGLASSLLGQRVNASGMDQEFRADDVGRILAMAGFESKGAMKLIDGRSGLPYHCHVSVGIVQVQLIQKTIEETVNWTGTLDVHPWSMQPVKGKKAGGGIRMGVQELDTMLYHSSEGMRESIYSVSSDAITVPACAVCGRIAAPSLQIGKYECTYCANTVPVSERYRARDIVKAEIAGAWRHISQTLLMRGIQATFRYGGKQ